MQEDGIVKPRTSKNKLAPVPFAARQAGEVQKQFAFGEANTRWSWTESSVWTDAMLTALENGVKGGRWSVLAKCLLCDARAVLPRDNQRSRMSIHSVVNHQLESRMRETRPYGSEGGETGKPVFPTPIETNQT